MIYEISQSRAVARRRDLNGSYWIAIFCR